MANPQGAGAGAEKTRSQADRPNGGQTAAEARSFSDQADQQMRKGGETARALAESGRRQANQAVEGWRKAMDPLTAMQMDMTRWFDDMWRRSTGMGAPMLRPGGLMGGVGPSSLFGLPACDLRETDEAYHLAIELPGMTREDIDLQARDNLLTVCGNKSEERDESGAAYRISERRFGRFERSFPIPPDVDAGAIEAGFRDGVLKVTLPRTRGAEKKGAKIAIG